MQFDTPILFLTYNRISTSQKVFEAIREVRPSRLYFASNSANSEDPIEISKINEVRNLINKIDWNCQVQTLYQEKHLPVKVSIITSINWFFKNEEQGIILEDDCLPSIAFFKFAGELLVKYKYDMRVWHIGGVCTLSSENFSNEDSYYFSKFNHIWGWATWKSRWDHYDSTMPSYHRFIKDQCINNIFDSDKLCKMWIKYFDDAYNNKINTWDYQWYFTTWINNGLSIIPSKNLVSNIGFGNAATHTTDVTSKLANMKVDNFFQIKKHPEIILANYKYDKINALNLFEHEGYPRILRLLKRIQSRLKHYYKIISIK